VHQDQLIQWQAHSTRYQTIYGYGQ